MKKLLKIILFAIILTLLVAIVVFTKSNSPKPIINSTIKETPSVIVPTNLSKVTSSELASHNKKADCWVAYKGKVYDITGFLPKHPGSAGAIAPFCGKSKEFEAAFTGQHGTSQVDTLIAQSVYKGDLA